MAVNLISSEDISIQQTGSDITLNVEKDNEVSTSSTKPVENQAITNYVNISAKGVVLYSSASGSQDASITLSDNIGNYDYIEIFFSTSWVYGSQKIFVNKSNTVKSFPLNIIYGAGTTNITFMVNVYSISNNTLTIQDNGDRARNGYIDNGNIVSLSKSNQIKIFRVVGYK